MKEVIIAVKDETKTEVVEKRKVAHLSELGESVKEAVNDFTQLNGGVVLPPVSIEVHDKDAPDAEATGDCPSPPSPERKAE